MNTATPVPAPPVINWSRREDPDFWQWDQYPADRVVKLVLGPTPGSDDKERLALSPEEVHQLAERIASFPQLTHLHLWKLGGLKVLSRLPDALQCLDLRGCQSLTQLTHLPRTLENLDLEDCSQLSILPAVSAARSLPELTDLNLKACARIPERWIHSILEWSPALLRFDASKCSQLKSIKVWPAALRRIELNQCEALEQLPDSWPATVYRLGLRGAVRLKDLAMESALPALDYLDLAGTQSLDLLPPLREQLRTLYLFGSRIALDPALLGEDENTNVAPRVHPFQKEAKAGTKIDNEVKLILLGNGRSGKTSVVRWVLGEPFDPEEKSTHGVRLWVKPLSFHPTEGGDREEAQVNIWDFAGQNLYHNTHRLFLQSKAVFVICDTPFGLGSSPENDAPLATEPEENFGHDLKYWIEQIRSLGLAPGMEGPPPILVVCTKVDRESEKPGTLAAHLNRLRYTAGDLKVLQFTAVEVDPKDEALRAKQAEYEALGADLLEELRAAIGEVLGRQAQRRLPSSVLRIKEELRAKKAENEEEFRRAEKEVRAAVPPYPHLSRSDFDTLVARHCPSYPPLEMLQLFHRSGYLYYANPLLKDTVILDQRWILDAIYVLTERGSLMREYLKDHRGQATASDLERLAWNVATRESDPRRRRYSTKQQKLFLKFMLDCGICFELLSKEISRNGEAWYAFPAFFRCHDALDRPHDEFKRGPYDTWQRITIPNCSESHAERAVTWLGQNWGRSAVLWRWGGEVQAADTRSQFLLDWQTESNGRYFGSLKIWFHGKPDGEFLRVVLKELLPLLGRSTDTEALAGLGVEQDWLRTRHAGLRGEMSEIGDGLMPEGFRPDDPGRKIDSPRQKSRIKIALSFAGGDKRNPMLDKVPQLLAEQLQKSPAWSGLIEVVNYKNREGAENLSDFTKGIAKGDIIIVFLSKKYWQSIYCMTELMLICLADKRDGLLGNRAVVFAFDGARLRKDKSVRKAAVEKLWRKRAFKREEKIRSQAEMEVKKAHREVTVERAEVAGLAIKPLSPAHLEAEAKIRRMDGVFQKWYGFIADQHKRDSFLLELLEYRLTLPLSQPKTNEEALPMTEKIRALVEKLMLPADKLIDAALECLKDGKHEQAVTLLQQFLVQDSYRMKNGLKHSLDHPGNNAIPPELLKLALQQLYGSQNPSGPTSTK